MSHPSLGLPPRDLTAGHPDAATRLGAARTRVATIGLETAVAGDRTFRDRYSDHALRELLADALAFVDRLAVAVAAADPAVLAGWVEQVAPRYRKRNVPMDDLIALAEGVRRAAATAVEPSAMPAVDMAVDAAIKVARWQRRIAGDARKRNPIIDFIYKGA